MKQTEDTQRRDESRKPLTFYIDGKKFESTEQYKTGAQLKHLAGIPLKTNLFQEVEEGYEPELIENDKKVDLAHKETERFFVKDKLIFTINGEQFVSCEQYILGSRIKQLGKIPATEEVFLKIAPP